MASEPRHGPDGGAIRVAPTQMGTELRIRHGYGGMAIFEI